jgi:hypothetical protein
MPRIKKATTETTKDKTTWEVNIYHCGDHTCTVVENNEKVIILKETPDENYDDVPLAKLSRMLNEPEKMRVESSTAGYRAVLSGCSDAPWPPRRTANPELVAGLLDVTEKLKRHRFK